MWIRQQPSGWPPVVKGRISVVLPVRHVNEPWLRASIESVLSQDYPDKELIVVNDEATQDIDALVASYGIRKYVKNDRNHKLPYSLNRGFEQADGEFHTWTSADNYMLPGMLTRLAAELRANAACGIAFGRAVVIDEAGRVLQQESNVFGLAGCEAKEAIVPRRYTYISTLGGCFLYRAGVWRDLGGYDERIHGAEDYDFWIRASRTFEIRHLPDCEEPHYAYRVHGASMSSSVKGCYTRLRVGILARELARRPADGWAWRALAFYGGRWALDGARRMRQVLLQGKRG